MHQYTAGLANRMTDANDVSLVTTTRFPKDRYSPAVSVSTPLATNNSGLSIESFRYWQIGNVKRAIEEAKPDVVHITGPHLWNVLIVRWLQSREIPVIHTLHDLDPHVGARYGRLLHIWNNMISRSVDRILIHGRVYHKRLIKSGLQHDKIVFIPLLHLFVGFDNLEAAAAAATEPSYENFILFFGRIEEYKGVEILLEAHSQLRLTMDSESTAPTLVLAGNGRLGEGWSTRLPDGVDLLNRFIDDHEAIRLFRTCSLVVLPYLDGTQSAVIASTYYFKKPVIATRVGALPEYIDEGKTGLTVDPDDPKALSLAILEIMNDETKLRRMGIAGREWYDKQREMELSSLLSLYDQFNVSS